MNTRNFIFFTLILGLLASCTPIASDPPPTPETEQAAAISPSYTPTSIIIPSATATSSPTPQPTATATPQCSDVGSVEAGLVPNQNFGRDLPYRVYLPPCYMRTSEPMPVLYLLHGLAGDDQQWFSLGLSETADRLILNGTIPPMLIVLPWQRTGVEVEPAIIEGLLPHVASTYRTRSDSRGLAIGGLSRGAGWAFRLGLKHSDTFSRIGLHSPAILPGDLTSFELWLADSGEARVPDIWIDIGDQDSLRSATNELKERLNELDVQYEATVRPGDHLAEYWQSNIADYLVWYSEAW